MAEMENHHVCRSPAVIRVTARVAGLMAATLLAASCSGQSQRSGLPADVRAFVAKRAQCDHLRGEEPYDAARAAELERGMRQTCQGTDSALARLKRVHHRNRPAMRALADYDPRIE